MRVLEGSIFLDRKDDTYRKKELDKRSKRIRILMEEKHLTFGMLAEKMDISEKHLTSVVNGKKALTDKILRSLADTLGVTPKHILEGGPKTQFEENIHLAGSAAESIGVTIAHLKKHGITFSLPEEDGTCEFSVNGERFFTSFDAVNEYVQSIEATFAVLATSSSKLLPRL